MKRKVFLFLIFVANSISLFAQENAVNKVFDIDSLIPSYIDIIEDGNAMVTPRKSLAKRKDGEFYLKEALNLNSRTTVALIDTISDVAGGFHESYAEFYDGIPVWGTRYTIHYNKSADIVSLNGNFRSISDMDTNPVISESEAFKIALTPIGIDTFFVDNDIPHNLVIYVKNDVSHLAYLFDIDENKGVDRYFEVVVDACNGEIIESYDANCYVSKVGNADTKYSGRRQITTEYDNSKYILYDKTRGNGIKTVNSKGTVYSDNDNNWTSSEYSTINSAALDAHWGVECVYDFYKSTFGRNGYDNKGGAIVNVIMPELGSNAQWNNTKKQINYGIYKSVPYTSLDIVAHEYTHGVIYSTANI